MKQTLLLAGVLIVITSSHALGACGSYVYHLRTMQPGTRECRFGNLFVCECSMGLISKPVCEFKYRGKCQGTWSVEHPAYR